MVTDQAYSQFALWLNCPPISCHQGNEQERVKLLALGSGALLLEEECLTLYALWLPQASEEFIQTKVTFGE